MKNLSLAILTLFTISLFLSSCDGTCPPEDENYANLDVKWEGQVIYSEVLTEDDNDTTANVMLNNGDDLELTKFAHQAFYDPNDDENWQFGCLASKQGFYSILPQCRELQTIEIEGDSDFRLADPNLVCGLLYNKSIGRLPNIDLSIFNTVDSTYVGLLSSNEYGRYAIDLPFGEYSLSFDMETVILTLDSFYQDVELVNIVMVDKPNIYLYPEEETKMDVLIDFPKGGRITVSDPEYGKGWNNITVTPDGIINRKHDFLFYESATSDFETPDNGWVIAQQNLEVFFIQNMKETGFVGREIDDFIDFWIPIFKDHKFYEIYPLYQKELDEKIVLNFSQQPDNMQRLIYIVKGRNEKGLKLEKPAIPAFERKGFVVTEWGVIRR